MKDSDISEIAKKNKEITGLTELIDSSNQRIKTIRDELINVAFMPSEPGMDIFVKYRDCILDNIVVRQ